MSKLMTYSMVSIIVILITAFVLFNFLGKIKEAYAEATAKQTCKTSVRTHATLKIRYADFSGDIKCPTLKINIEDKNEEIVKKKIADAMYDCWDQFGEGKLELFSDDSVYCAICHRISFDKDIKVNGLTEFLATNKAPQEKISYLQFLTTEQTSNSDFLREFENKKIVDTIDASKNSEYAVIFTYIKGKKFLEDVASRSATALPGVASATIGLGIVWKSGAIASAVGSIATPLVGALAGGTVITVGTLAFGIGLIWTYVGATYGGIPFEHIALISLIPYDAQSIQSLNCRQLPIK